MASGDQQLRVDRYTTTDRPGFADLVNEVHSEFGFTFDPNLDADLDDPARFYRQIWVLRRGESVVGTVALTPAQRGVVTLKRMYLRADLRGLGWGRQLLETALGAAASNGCRRVELDTSDRQRAACRLYESAGFRLVRRAGQTRYYAKDIGQP